MWGGLWAPVSGDDALGVRLAPGAGGDVGDFGLGEALDLADLAALLAGRRLHQDRGLVVGADGGAGGPHAQLLGGVERVARLGELQAVDRAVAGLHVQRPVPGP